MSSAPEALLTALQFGDGQFPGGGFAFSWGLESLVADGRLARAGFPAFVGGQLQHRWAGFDRILAAHAHAAASDLPRLHALDDLADALMTVDSARVGSRRAGRALLGTHVRLGTPGAAAFRGGVAAGQAHGHLPIVQGVVLAGVGLDRAAALAVSAYTMAQALCTAAIRLGLIGHLDAQRTLADLRPGMARLAAQDSPGLDAISTFVPVSDIAMLRHADQAQRLFSN
ncbi:urease accessory protein UreF [Vineibacter terrae]|uniref:urease accessory protein UreF n=1 Tax=Vineibacter terrae TaxID=2586908 RepID=UPI0015B5E65B|nr:urease accessory UreF family protein [Vineibacter terrae]